MRKKIENTIYFAVLIPLIIIAISILYQKIVYPEKIPNIFGYKVFIVFDENMDSSLKYGDLVITNNKQTKKLKENDMIAYRSVDDKVTIHRIKKNEEINENTDEGKVVNVIPHVGYTLYFIQQPINFLMISGAIIVAGGIGIIIAKKLDQKEMEKISKNTEDNKIEEKHEKISV